LREAIVEPVAARAVCPRPNLLEDQIVWGRSPVRLDLAGGWTDTPPYCLFNGGGVVNVAVDLNGQPPLQVFIKRRETPDIILRSIDLGVEERVSTYAQIADYATVGGPFSIIKAALALTGFHPHFQGAGMYSSLKEQLKECGGGLELSLLAAVPKGSGLGTSSILAATALGTIGNACGLGWTEREIIIRTLALEQLLTTGGGWQDQAGGVLRGIKFVETRPGLTQEPVVRWLPDQPFGPAYANQTILLYYTGITRVAKGILQEIVRGMFLNSAAHLDILREIGAHARRTCDVIQRGDHAAIAHAVAQSWELNQRLDPGTNTPIVQAILARIEGWLAGAKLLGAGGGGYLLMFAKDAAAAARIRDELTVRPPNAKARFVEISLSQTGLQITRS
jgi:galactokinase/mevalonate kinase-like predicted kinase